MAPANKATQAGKPRLKGRFVPGISGNPSGRPKQWHEFKVWVEEKCLPKAQDGLERCLSSKDERIVLLAVKEVLDRLYGKPAQVITGPEGGPVQVASDLRDRITEILARKG